MTVYMVIPLPKLPYIHTVYVWYWPTLDISNDKHELQLTCRGHVQGAIFKHKRQLR
jgi:hypothetical protein